MERSATIVRTKEEAAGSQANSTDEQVIKMMIQGKLQADSETAKANFEVDAKNGEVMLKGTADSAATIGRAIALALDTKGVTKVSADAKVGPATKP